MSEQPTFSTNELWQLYKELLDENRILLNRIISLNTELSNKSITIADRNVEIAALKLAVDVAAEMNDNPHLKSVEGGETTQAYQRKANDER